MTKRFGKVESYKVKQGIFAALVLVVFLTLYFVLINAVYLANVVMLIGGIGLFFILIQQYDYLLTLKEYERALIFRFGRAHRVGGPGWTLLLPAVETFRIVDLRTQTLDVKPQTVITKDNIVVVVDAVIYLFVKSDADSVTKSVIEVYDYKRAASTFIQAQIRDVAGTMTLNELVSDIGKLNERLQNELKQIATNWGVSVESVEIQDLQVPKEVEEAFSKRAAAEQGKLAQIQRAMGVQGEIESIREAAQKLDDRSLSYFYIKTLESMGQGASTKFVLPMELTSFIDHLAQSTKRAHSKKELETIFEEHAPALFEFMKKMGKGNNMRKKKPKKK